MTFYSFFRVGNVINFDGHAYYIFHDFRFMEKLFATAWEKFGRLDVVIANAGVINFGYTWELTDEQVEKVLSIDLEGTWRTDKYATQYNAQAGLWTNHQHFFHKRSVRNT